MVEEDASFADIDEATIKKYLRKAEEAGRLPDIEGLSMPELLETAFNKKTANSNVLPSFCLARIPDGFTQTLL